MSRIITVSVRKAMQGRYEVLSHDAGHEFEIIDTAGRSTWPALVSVFVPGPRRRRAHFPTQSRS